MQAIQDKIDNGNYDLDDDIAVVEKNPEDLFFATEIETNYQEVRAQKAQSIQQERQKKQQEDLHRSVMKKMSNNQIVSNQLALVN